MANILIVDDEIILRKILCRELKMIGHTVFEAGDGEEAILYLHNQIFDLVVTDMKMPKKDGIEVLKEAKRIHKRIIVIMITAYSTVENAVHIMKIGADDYIVKPFNTKDFVANIEQILAAKKILNSFSDNKRTNTDALLGSSPVMLNLKKMLQKVCNLKTTVLLTGESGTGKGVVAKEIHRMSDLNKEPFVHLDCSALNPNLIESELFGSEKGSFTSSTKTQVGKMEMAGNGTLFLDEIGNLPIELQSKLLLVLEDRFFYRVGGTKAKSFNARIITATNANLESMVEEGKFREDLFYRLNVVNIDIPPLRYRKEDIDLLISEFIAKSEIARQKEITGADLSFLAAAQNYDWPGNVRELENAVESALALSEGFVLTVEDMPVRILNKKRMLAHNTNTQLFSRQPLTENVDEVVKILEALDKFDGHREKTAAYLGISRRTLQYKLKKYNLL